MSISRDSRNFEESIKDITRDDLAKVIKEGTPFREAQIREANNVLEAVTTHLIAVYKDDGLMFSTVTELLNRYRSALISQGEIHGMQKGITMALVAIGNELDKRAATKE